jgi:hypothetical protein
MPLKNIKDARIDEINIGDATAGSTLDGNIQIMSNSPFPLINFRNGTTTQAYIAVGTESGAAVQAINSSMAWNSISSGLNLVVLHETTGLQISNAATIPDSPSAGSIRIWSQSGEGKIMDESGNVTTFSPHNTDGIVVDADDVYPVTVHHKNPYLGIEQWIYLSKLARLVEKLTGEKIIYDEPIQQKDWAADEQNAHLKSVLAIEKYDAELSRVLALGVSERENQLRILGTRPETYSMRPEPDWIKNRKNNRE